MSKKVLLMFISVALTLIFIIMPGCSPGEKETGADEEFSHVVDKVDEIFEGDFTIPLPKDYPVTFVELREPLEILKVGHHTVTISYGLEKGDLWELFKDEEIVEEFEKSRGVSILYGPYEGTGIASVEYSPTYKTFEQYSDDDVTGSWKIKNKEIEYIHISTTIREVILLHLGLVEGGIFVTYYLSEEFTEKDAKNFTKYLVDKFY